MSGSMCASNDEVERRGFALPIEAAFSRSSIPLLRHSDYAANLNRTSAKINAKTKPNQNL
jgi:hypothetical protein